MHLVQLQTLRIIIPILSLVWCSLCYLHGDERSSRHRLRNKLKNGGGHSPQHTTPKDKGVLDPGHRIVDAAQIHPNERFPFLVVFNFHPVAYAKCTGSLISRKWVLSAAHCLGPKEKISLDDCGSTLEMKVRLKCKLLENDDLKISPVGRRNRPEVLVGVSNIHRDYDKIEPHYIDHIIRPRDAYPGGNYGTYGGYDVILIKLRDAVDGISPVCLPNNAKYPDTGNATIAGYGRFKRPPCEVGAQGPHKFEFCGVDKDCVKGSQKHTEANCSVTFPYKGKKVSGCLHEPTPSASDPRCRDLLAKEAVEFSPTLDEAVVVSKTSQGQVQVVARCFRQEPGSFGWCGTIHDYTGFERQQIEVSPGDGWGFCQKSCFPSPDEELGGVERFKHVEVISTDFCRRRLVGAGQSDEDDGDKGEEIGFEVEPKVLCVAFNHTYHTHWYLLEEDDANQDYHDQDSQSSSSSSSEEGGKQGGKGRDDFSGDRYSRLEETPSLRKATLGRREDWYIVGTGSCAGDSGGPLFKQVGVGGSSSPATEGGGGNDGKKEFVLIGVTSRGTGIRGNCGGRDNPTHYVRIKLFLKWIRRYVRDEDLCFSLPPDAAAVARHRETNPEDDPNEVDPGGSKDDGGLQQNRRGGRRKKKKRRENKNKNKNKNKNRRVRS